MNTDKCYLLISNHNEEILINLAVIVCSNTIKLLGITIENKLDFSIHVSNLFKKVGQILHALSRISKFMSQNKLTLLLKAFIESQFGYWMFHSRTLNNHINRLHKRALTG